MKSLINHRTINLDVSELVTELRAIRHVLEQVFQVDSPTLVPYRDFDPDDYSSVMFHDEEQEIVDQHLARRVAGLDLGL